MRKQTNSRKQNGFSILEVVIGIFIFVVGMLALASLQGALTRSMADSKLRTTAVNIADRLIEAQRGFTQLATAATPGVPFAYNDIVSSEPVIPPVNGVTYTVDMDVTDYYYQLSADAFCTSGDADCPTGVSSSSYKQVEVTVSWSADQGFRADEGSDITVDSLGSGSITLTSVIPAIITSASARVADESSGGDLVTNINYNPGANPDVVALALGDSKFKESLLPEPDVQRTDELVQTTFDVITYSQSDGSVFLRREEFAAVSCECTLRDESADFPARRPVIWAGDEYAAGHFVVKTYGESANVRNSSLCDSCCRDHHDGGVRSAEDSGDPYANVFGPFKADAEYPVPGQARGTSDHAHYQSDGTIAGNGDEYLEACRLVRVDGFFRVAQDFRREDQYVFPEDFLSSDADITTYSAHVTGAAIDYEDAVIDGYPTSLPPCIGRPEPAPDPTKVTLPCVAIPDKQGSYPSSLGSGELPSWTTLQTGVTGEQQLRSRGIFIDYMSNDLRLFMTGCFEGETLKNDCCIRDGAVANSCTADDLYIDRVTSANKLEILPFFEVQMTKLENWDQTQQVPLTISLTNEAIEDANAHRRGEAAQWIPKKETSIILGETEVKSESHRGNIGFTNTLAIDPLFEDLLKHAHLQVVSLDANGNGSNTSGTAVRRIEGSFSEGVTGDPTIRAIGGGDADCGLKAGGFWCNVAIDWVDSPTVIIDGYEDVHILVPDLDPPDEREVRYACSGSLIRTISNAVTDNTNATFSLLDSASVLLSAGSDYNIRIEPTDCSG